MRILVTGGGGFIGSHLSAMLVAGGHDVTVLDREPARVVGGARLLRAELTQPGVADDAVHDTDAVYHLAARVGLGLDWNDAPDYVSDNDLGTARLLAALGRRRFAGRLVLASSMVVYGEGRYRCADHGTARAAPRTEADLRDGRFDPRCATCGRALDWEAVTESDPLQPRSVYAATKLAQEHLATLWARETAASVVALRFHNVYGPGLPIGTPYAGVAALFRDRLRRGLPALVFEDGRQARDFVHVSDVARASVAALDAEVSSGTCEPVNVGSGRPTTVLEFATALTAAFGGSAPSPQVNGRFRLGDVRHIVASSAKAAQLLQFRAAVSLAEGTASLAVEEG